MQESYEALAGRVVELALQRGADEAEARLSDGSEFSVSVRKGSVDKLVEASTRMLGLRVFVGGRTASTFTADLAPASLARFVDRSLELAAIADPDPDSALPDWEEQPVLPPLDLYDPAIANLSTEAKIELATRCERAAFDFDARISNSDGGSFGSETTVVTLVNSRGFAGSYSSSAVSLSVEVMADDADGKKRNDYWYSVERHLDRLEDPETVGRKAAERALRRLGARKVATQQAPIVFDPQAARGLVRVLAGAVSGSALERRASFLVGQEGQRVAAPQVTLLDNAALPGRLGSRPFDAEGVSSRANTVIKRGVFQSFLFDTYTARKTGHQSTGNSSRSPGGPAGVGPSNLILQPGTTPPAEIIASVENGLYLTDMMGFGVNLTTGDFSRGAGGIWIEHGRLSYPVAEITISGNLRQMLLDLELLGNDLEWQGSMAAPTLRLSSMMISGL